MHLLTNDKLKDEETKYDFQGNDIIHAKVHYHHYVWTTGTYNNTVYLHLYKKNTKHGVQATSLQSQMIEITIKTGFTVGLAQVI